MRTKRKKVSPPPPVLYANFQGENVYSSGATADTIDGSLDAPVYMYKLVSVGRIEETAPHFVVEKEL